MLTPLSIFILGALAASTIILLAIIFGQWKSGDGVNKNKEQGKDK